MSDQLQQVGLFPSTIYSITLPQFLDSAREVSSDALAAVKQAECCGALQHNPLYPHTMSGNYANDPRLQELVKYVAQTAWNVLDSQGYAMQNLVTAVAEAWTQEHEKGSDMPVHVHPGGIQLNAFYFLDCPENGCQVAFHDPRPGKCASQLLQASMANVTSASDIIYYKPEPGMLMLANSWLPHAFSRNGSDEPFRFIHINLVALPAPQPDVEVV